jgi:hypothetical protein
VSLEFRFLKYLNDYRLEGVKKSGTFLINDKEFISAYPLKEQATAIKKPPPTPPLQNSAIRLRGIVDCSTFGRDAMHRVCLVSSERTLVLKI